MQADAYLRKLEPVVQQLQKDIPEARYDKRSLAQMVAQLLQFTEVALGINVSPTDLPQRVPRHQDTSEKSSHAQVYLQCMGCFPLTGAA